MLHPSMNRFLLTKTTDCRSHNVFLIREMTRDEWTTIENAVDRTEAAVIEEATAIAQLRRQLALVIEALEKLDLCKLQGLENHTQGEGARERYREILQQLKASYAAKSSPRPAQSISSRSQVTKDNARRSQLQV
jgi:hypothetical protein